MDATKFRCHSPIYILEKCVMVWVDVYWFLDLMPYLQHFLIKNWSHGIRHDVILKRFRRQHDFAFHQLFCQFLQGSCSSVDLELDKIWISYWIISPTTSSISAIMFLFQKRLGMKYGPCVTWENTCALICFQKHNPQHLFNNGSQSP